MTSAFKDVITQLEKQKAAIEKAIAALQDVGDDAVEQREPAKRGRPNKAVAKKASAKKTTRKGALSPEARERIAAAQRKRWAATKKATAKKSA